MSCAAINADMVAFLCGKVAAAGTGATHYVFNYEDIDRSLTTVVDNVVTAFVLKSGKSGYLFTTTNDSAMAESAIVKGTYIDQISQKVTLRAHAKTEAAKAWANNALNSKVVIIVMNNETGTAGEIKYEVYGLDSGLDLTEIAFTTDMADQTVYSMVFASSEKSAEATLPKSFFKTDLATTETALDSLVGNS